MRRLAVLLLLGMAGPAGATQPNEGTVVELAPLVVSDSFALQLTRPESEQAVQIVARMILEKEAKDAAHERAGIFEAKFWGYVPIRLSLMDEREFFAPSYLSTAAGRADRQLRASEKNPLIAPLTEK